MDISIKKDLASNWFKLLQNAICDDILKIEKNKVNFQSTSWNRSIKKDDHHLASNGNSKKVCVGPNAPMDGPTFPRLDAETPRADSKSSVGLGLSIASDIIRSHGGNIKLEKSKLSGLRVRIFLPV